MNVVRLALLALTAATAAARANVALLDRARRTHERLARSEERFALAVAGSNDGIWDWDLRTNEVFYSPRWKQMLGYDDDEIANAYSEWERLVHPDDRDRALATIADHVEGRTAHYELEHRLLHKDGTYRTILSRGLVQRDVDGQAVRMAGSHADITELRAAQTELERKNRELDAFASAAAHDLRGPLVSIEGFSSSLERHLGDVLDARGRMHIERIRANTQALQALISDLHGFARASVQESSSERTDADDLARDLLRELGPRIEERGATVELVGRIPPVRVHPVQFRQALANLLENALAYAGGDEPARVRIEPAIRNGHVELAVEDNGPGIPADERERLFEPFERGRRGRRTVPAGTGLGLALVKRIAESSGGSLRYEHRPSRGARFILSLPKGSS